MKIDELQERAYSFHQELSATKAELAPPSFWYPYTSLGNIEQMNVLLGPQHRDITTLASGRPIADIGGGDGDVAFFLESAGFDADLVDHGATNFNGLEGAKKLKDRRGSSVEIFDIDLDSQFALPRPDYGLVLFLGILYHLQNPFYAMKALARSAEWCVVSTRVAAGTADRAVHFAHLPLAYLVAPLETNNDPTNYWIFSESGLCRLLDRAGWEVVDYMTVGCTSGDSDPSSPDRDQRVFALLHSGTSTGEYAPHAIAP